MNRTSNLLANKSFTDVTFIVGPPTHSKKYVGHRVLLAMTSPVFESMFYGNDQVGSSSSNNNNNQRVIRIPDLAPIGFENLLRYAYTDSLKLNSVEDSMLTAAAAKKYLLPHLLRECLNYVEKNLSPSSATSVYEFSLLIFSPALQLKAIQMIDRNTFHVISNKAFCSVQSGTLEFICNRKYLNLYSEYALFNRIICWALQESKRRSLMSNHSPTDWSIVRIILQEAPILKSIRFLSMTPEEFTRLLVSTSSPDSFGATHSNTLESFMNEHSEKAPNIQESGAKKSTQQQQQPLLTSSQDLNSSTNQINFKNSLLSMNESVSIFMNLAIPGIKEIPKGKTFFWRQLLLTVMLLTFRLMFGIQSETSSS